MWDIPDLNSQPQDDNPAGVSSSLPTANSGWWEKGTQLLGVLLDHQVKKDAIEAGAVLTANGQYVAPKSATATLSGAQAPGFMSSPLVVVGVLAVLGVVAFVAVKKLA